jgi:hypothetical protein
LFDFQIDESFALKWLRLPRAATSSKECKANISICFICSSEFHFPDEAAWQLFHAPGSARQFPAAGFDLEQTGVLHDGGRIFAPGLGGDCHHDVCTIGYVIIVWRAAFGI